MVLVIHIDPNCAQKIKNKSKHKPEKHWNTWTTLTGHTAWLPKGTSYTNLSSWLKRKQMCWELFHGISERTPANVWCLPSPESRKGLSNRQVKNSCELLVLPWGRKHCWDNPGAGSRTHSSVTSLHSSCSPDSPCAQAGFAFCVLHSQARCGPSGCRKLWSQRRRRRGFSSWEAWLVIALLWQLCPWLLLLSGSYPLNPIASSTFWESLWDEQLETR